MYPFALFKFPTPHVGLDSEEALSDHEDSHQIYYIEHVTNPEAEKSSDKEIGVRKVPQTSSAKRCVWRNRKMSKSLNYVVMLFWDVKI